MSETDEQQPFQKPSILSNNSPLPPIPSTSSPTKSGHSDADAPVSLTTLTQDDLERAVLTEFFDVCNRHPSKIAAHELLDCNFDHRAVAHNIATFEDDLLDSMIDMLGPLPESKEIKIPPYERRICESILQVNKLWESMDHGTGYSHYNLAQYPLESGESGYRFWNDYIVYGLCWSFLVSSKQQQLSAIIVGRLQTPTSS